VDPSPLCSYGRTTRALLAFSASDSSRLKGICVQIGAVIKAFVHRKQAFDCPKSASAAEIPDEPSQWGSSDQSQVGVRIQGRVSAGPKLRMSESTNLNSK
jgi:hypothetical protein